MVGRYRIMFAFEHGKPRTCGYTESIEDAISMIQKLKQFDFVKNQNVIGFKVYDTEKDGMRREVAKLVHEEEMQDD